MKPFRHIQGKQTTRKRLLSFLTQLVLDIYLFLKIYSTERILSGRHCTKHLACKNNTQSPDIKKFWVEFERQMNKYKITI